MPSGDLSAAGSSKATKAQMRDCVSKQMANNASQTKDEAKKYCKNQLSASPNG